MNNQTLSDLLGNTVVIFLLQVAIFSLPPFYIATLRRPLRSAAFYVYVSIVLVIGGFLGAVYSIPLTESIVISGGNLAYGALMYATILLVITEADIFATRNVIRLVITVNVLKYILFSVFSWSLSLNTILNPFDTAPDLFAVSAKLMIIGGVLIIVELLILLFFFEQIKTRVSNFYAQFILFVVSFMAVLLLDGVLFPLIAFGINASLESIVVGGIVGKFVMAAAYSVALLGFLFIFRNRLTTYLAIPIGLRDLLTANREKLIEEIAKKDQALHESEERLRLALKASGQGLYDLNLQTGAAEVNDQYALMLGYDPETFEETNAKWIERLHPDDHERVTQHFQAYVAGEIPEYRVDFRQKTKEGNWVWISSLGETVEYDSQGNPLRLVGTHINITDRKHQELNLLETTRLLEKTFASLHEAVFVINPADRTIVTCNPAVERVFGYTPVELIGQSTAVLYHNKEDFERFGNLSESTLTQTGLFEIEYKMWHKDGYTIMTENTVTSLREQTNWGEGVVSVVRNVTDRKAIEAEMQLAEARYQALFEYSPVSLWEEDFSEVKQAIDQLIGEGITDLETYLRQHKDLLQLLVSKVKVLDVNQRTLALYRLDNKEQLLGSLKISNPTLLDNFISQLVAIAKGDTMLKFTSQTSTADGERLDIVLEWTVQPGYEADYGRVLISIIDITAVVQAEQALAENRRRLQALFDHSRDAIFLADDQARYVDVNPSACDLTGYSREELLQRTVWDISPGRQEAESQALWQQFIAAGEMGGEFLIEDINGHRIETEFSATANITPGLHLSIMRDITERKQTEEKINRAQLLLKEMGSIAKIGGWELDLVTMEPTFTEETFRIYELPPTKPPKLEDGLSYYPPESRPLVEKVVQAAIEENLPYDIEVPFITAKGRTIWVRTQGRVHLKEGKADRLYGSIQDITDRKVAEEALQQQEEFLSSLLESAPVSIYVVGDDDKMRLVNPVWEADTGQSRTDALGKRLDQVFSPDVARKLAADNQSVIKTDTLLTVDEEIEKRFFRTVKSPLRNTKGQVDGVVGISVDITARVQAEQQLQEYTQRLEALHRIDRAILAQNSPEHIAKVTVDHLAQLISCKRISASRFDEVGQTATVLAAHVAGTTRLMQGMLVPIHDLDSFLANLRQGKTKIFDDLQQFAGSAPTIDALLEEGLRSYMTVPLMAGGRLIGSLSLGSDQINDFDENHEQLVKEVADQLAISLLSADLYNAEKSQRALAETLQATAVALVGILTLEETLDTILTQLALVVPYDLAQTLLIRDELLAVGARQGRLATDLVEEEERPYTQIPILNQSLQSGKPVVLTASQIQENHLNLPGMVPALSSWVGIPLVARGVAVGFLTVGQIDAQYFPQQINAITTFAQQAALAIEKATILLELENSVQTLQETQAQLVRAARLSAIGETAAGVAHQINNPLTTVIIDSHLLLKNLPASHAARQSAEAIHQAALRAASVVERLLDFSRTQPTAKSPVDISDSLNESITILKAQIPENVRIKLDINPDLPLVIASPEHLQDVWLNLLLNARDAVSQLEKGNIRVTMTHSMRYNRVEVSVQDNGMGIPYDEQQKIFKPFYTTKPRGTGLGLAVCQDIILHHDGEIRVSSVEGEGSVFTVMLPL